MKDRYQMNLSPITNVKEGNENDKNGKERNKMSWGVYDLRHLRAMKQSK